MARLGVRRVRLGAPPADLVAIFGVGGLGHLALQYARIAGAQVVAVPGRREAPDGEGAGRPLHRHVFELHVAGVTKVEYEKRRLDDVKEAIRDVERAAVKARVVFDLS